MKNIKLIFLIFATVANFFLTLAFDAQGAITAKYVYDANNCLTKVVYSGGVYTSDDRTIDFTYDNNGNLTNVAAVGGKVNLIVINSQPVYTPVEVGGTITLSISATGDGIHPLSYQWQFLPDGGTWGDIPGANSPTLKLTGLTKLGNQGYYRCFVSDSVNSDLWSDAVKVYVLDPGVPDLWSSTTYLAPGSRFSIYDFEVSTLSAYFTAKPKLLKGELVQPVAGKTVTYPLTLLTAPTVQEQKETLDCVWPTAVLLYDKKKLTSSYASGFYCADFLGLYPQYDKDTFIVIQTATGTAQYLSRFFTLTSPEITAVRNSGDTADITSAAVGETIRVKGNYFGKKAPTVWLEYKVSGKPGVLKLLLKAVPPIVFPDEKNVAGKSYMNLDTGVSEISVQIPAKLPAGLITGANNIVIDNGQGLATFTFELL